MDDGSSVIVSLTSTRQRLETVHLTVGTILSQSRSPDRVVLWLSEEAYLLDEGVSREAITRMGRPETEGVGEGGFRFWQATRTSPTASRASDLPRGSLNVNRNDIVSFLPLAHISGHLHQQVGTADKISIETEPKDLG